MIFNLKASKQEHFYIFPGTKAQTFRAKKVIVSVPYFSALETPLENSLSVLMLYVKVLLILKSFPITAGKSP